MNNEPVKRVVEMHYTAQEIATLIRKSDRFVRDKIKSGAFGAEVFSVGGDYIVAASGVNAFLEMHRLQTPGVKARSEGELRRKVAAAAATESNGK
jgi:hypothetical protein